MHTATPEIYTLSLHDALPISRRQERRAVRDAVLRVQLVGELMQHDVFPVGGIARPADRENVVRSEEHTSELQSHSDLVCRLLLEKKNKKMQPVAVSQIFIVAI